MICSFCLSTVLSEQRMSSEGVHKPHHEDAASWARSLLDPGKCTICWALWYDAIEEIQDPTRPLPESYDHEKSLAEAISGCIETWPKYSTSISEQGECFWISTIRWYEPGHRRLPGRAKDCLGFHQSERFILQPASIEADSAPEHNMEQSLGWDTPLDGTDSPADHPLSCAVQWVRECNNNHIHCREIVERQRECSTSSGASPFIPARLLYVGTTDKPFVRLIDDTKLEGVRGPYTTLSHCWGDPSRFQSLPLLEDNFGDFCKDIPWDSLPLTFQESVIVSRKLNVHYLWIDALCIIQNDQKDWHKEAATMHMVYRNSYCNIAAGSSADGRGGLMQYQRPRWLPPETVAFQGRKYKITTLDFWEAQVLRQPLSQRAWVLQGKPSMRKSVPD